MFRYICALAFVCLPAFGQVVSGVFGGGGSGTTSVSGLTDIQGSTLGTAVSFTAGAVDVLGGARQAIPASSGSNTGAAYTGTTWHYVVAGDTQPTLASGAAGGVFTSVSNTTIVTGAAGYPTTGQFAKLGTTSWLAGVPTFTSAASIHPMTKTIAAGTGLSASETATTITLTNTSTGPGYAPYWLDANATLELSLAVLTTRSSTAASYGYRGFNMPHDASTHTAHWHMKLPRTATLTGNLIITPQYEGAGTTGNIRFSIQKKCIASGAQLYATPTFDASVLQTVAMPPVINGLGSPSFTVPLTGCTQGNWIAIQVQRLSSDAADTALNEIYLTGIEVEVPIT